MKKFFILTVIVISCILNCVTTFALNSHDLPNNVPFNEVLGLDSIDSITKGVIVFKDGKSAEMSLQDTKNLMEMHWDLAMDRVVSPVNYDTTETYYNIYTADKKFSLTGGSGICYGSFGEENYVWFFPYLGNARIALSFYDEEMYQKYHDLAVNSNESFEFPLNNDCLKLPTDNWAIPEIKKAATNNILPYSLMKDYKLPITREDFCKIIGLMLAQKAYNPSDDREGLQNIGILLEEKGITEITDPKFDDYEHVRTEIKYMYNLGIVSGKGKNTFYPNGTLTREEAARILHNTAKVFASDSTFPSEVTTFSDENEISLWAKEDVDFVVSNGILIGMGENRFTPKGKLTVQQAIISVQRLYTHLSK